jgi:signal transduction histidine kinase/ActR/RegA family two-component response regulator
MTLRVLNAPIASELDIVGARQRARQIAAMCGFGPQDQTRIATAVSELARNVYNYAGSGKLAFAVEGDTAPQVLVIRIEDKGPGIPNLDHILSGGFQSATGMGVGIAGARRLVDRFDITTAPGKGTEIVLQKLFPPDAPVLVPAMVGKLMSTLATLVPDASLAEVRQQNQELLSTLTELSARQQDLLQLTRELEDTNRGVVALYAELDQKAESLRRADESKTRFLSNMSHEFRTPLSSIRALAKLLLAGVDGDLSTEQEKQVGFILQGAVTLSEMVDDLLDLAKIEAGKVDVHPSLIDVDDMFGALRGMLRPLLSGDGVTLSFESPDIGRPLYCDEAKLSQILRNFISNALKFTETGTVTVSARYQAQDDCVRFSVADTGIGIAQEHLELVFEEFSQVESSLQRVVKGTGLGLPLCRSLATLLNGCVTAESTPGTGSVFSVVVPMTYVPPGEQASAKPGDGAIAAPAAPDKRISVLVVESDPHTQMLYAKYLGDSEFRIVPARSLREAGMLWTVAAPSLVILDVLVDSQQSWHWLAELKNDPQRRAIPVIVVTQVSDKRKAIALGADAYFVKPVFKPDLLASLRQLLAVRAGRAAPLAGAGSNVSWE